MSEFARDGNVLHVINDGAVVCGATGQENTTVGRDDVVCGKCMDILYPPAEDNVDFGDGEETACRLSELPYELYLRTHHWQTIRRAALDHYGPACLLCGNTGQVDVHHRTYQRRGSERLHDLTILCRDCHGRFHKAA